MSGLQKNKKKVYKEKFTKKHACLFYQKTEKKGDRKSH